MYTIIIAAPYFEKKPTSHDAREATAVANDTIDFYELFKMISRQIWAHKSYRYIQKIRREYSGRNKADENGNNNNTNL